MSPEDVVASTPGTSFLKIAEGLSLLTVSCFAVAKMFEQLKKAQGPVEKLLYGFGLLASVVVVVSQVFRTKLIDSVTAFGRQVVIMGQRFTAAWQKGGRPWNNMAPSKAYMDSQIMRPPVNKGDWPGLWDDTPGGSGGTPGSSGPPVHDMGGRSSRSIFYNLGRAVGGSPITKLLSSTFESVKPALKMVGQLFAGSLLTALGVAIIGPLIKLGTWFMQTANSVAVGLVRSGGSSGGDLHRLASRLGIGDAQLGGAAQSFGSLLNQGGIAAGFAAKLGIKPYGGLGGDQDFMSKYMTALKAVADEKDPSRASMMARYFGMEDMAWIRNADPTHKRLLFEQSGGANMSPEELTKAANAQIDFNRALADFQDTLRNIGAFILPLVTSALKNLVAILIGAFIGAVSGVPFGGIIGALAGWGVGHVVGSSMDSKADSRFATMDNHTKSMNRHASALDKNTEMMDGSYGGGALFNGNLIPRGWGQQLIDQAANGRSIALGAFAI